MNRFRRVLIGLVLGIFCSITIHVCINESLGFEKIFAPIIMFPVFFLIGYWFIPINGRNKHP